MPNIVVQKPFPEIGSYAEIASDYAYTLKTMKVLQFDIWLSSHASQLGMHKKNAPGAACKPAAFMDQGGYERSLDELQQAYEKKIGK